MNRGVVVGAVGGLVAGVSLGALALAAPSFALFAQNGTMVGAPAAAQLALPAMSQQARWGVLPDLADLVEAASPSVVQIEVRSQAKAQTMRQFGPNPFQGTPFEDFFQGAPGAPQGEMPDQRGSGSGFFVEGGYIVTNNHVVEDASKMSVLLSDGRRFDAELVGTDPKTDLAVIKIVNGKDMPRALPWGDSSVARPGDSVFAVGAPFGLSNTVTAGIVSARGRNLSGQYDDFIQVDAPINRGNSGGPLLDHTGAVIGVNSQIFSPSGGNVGIGFAIPSGQAKGIVQQIVQNGSVQRGWLGVAIAPVTPEIASSLKLPSAKGAMVNQVTADSPASKAGVREGDVILSFGDRPIASVQDLTRAVADTKAGTTRDLRIIRDGRDQTLKVNIAALKDEVQRPALASNAPNATRGGGLEMADLGLTLGVSGSDVVVTAVKVNSPAADAGIRTGDKLVKVNQTQPASPEAAKKAVDDAKKANGQAVLLQLERQGTKYFVGVPFGG